LILLFQNKFVKTHHHHSLCIRNDEGANRGFYEGFFKTLNYLKQMVLEKEITFFYLLVSTK